MSIFDEIKNNVDIVSIIGSYIPLVKAGSSYKGVCPFHNDKGPSLMVNSQKQIFHCFGCDEAGDVFKFVQLYKHISFVEAVKEVCAVAGIKAPADLKEKDVEQIDAETQRLYSLMVDLSGFYNYQLLNNENETAINYVKSRNLTNEDCKTFGIGYCPESGLESISFLRKKGYRDDEIISCGIGKDIGQGKISDRLRGRVIFSIKDAQGRIVAFSGRRINDSLGEKYVNTNETKIFKKSKVLYNYSLAKDPAKINQYLYIVEGFMDAIALYKAGIKSVVATMGTAFTSDHMDLLKQLNCELRLLFDSDTSGQIANNKCIDSLNGKGFKIKVVVPYKDYKDTDECLQKAGANEVVRLVNQLTNVIDYKFSYIGNLVNFNNHDDVKKYIDDCLKLLATMQLDDYDKSYYLSKIAEKTKSNIDYLNSRFSQLSQSKPIEVKKKQYQNNNFKEKHTYAEVKNALNRYEQADHQILKKMMEKNLSIVEYMSLDVQLTNKTSRQLANLIIDRHNNGLSCDIASLLEVVNSDQARLIGEIQKESYPEISMDKLAKIVNEDYFEYIKKQQDLEKLNNLDTVEAQAKMAQEMLNKKAMKLKKN